MVSTSGAIPMSALYPIRTSLQFRVLRQGFRRKLYRATNTRACETPGTPISAIGTNRNLLEFHLFGLKYEYQNTITQLLYDCCWPWPESDDRH
jgi:hypothetical protein